MSASTLTRKNSPDTHLVLYTYGLTRNLHQAAEQILQKTLVKPTFDIVWVDGTTTGLLAGRTWRLDHLLVTSCRLAAFLRIMSYPNTRANDDSDERAA